MKINPELTGCNRKKKIHPHCNNLSPILLKKFCKVLVAAELESDILQHSWVNPESHNHWICYSKKILFSFGKFQKLILYLFYFAYTDCLRANHKQSLRSCEKSDICHNTDPLAHTMLGWYLPILWNIWHHIDTQSKTGTRTLVAYANKNVLLWK